MRPRIRIDIDSRVDPDQKGSTGRNGKDFSETLRRGRKGYGTSKRIPLNISVRTEVRRPVVELDDGIHQFVPTSRR